MRKTWSNFKIGLLMIVLSGLVGSALGWIWNLPGMADDIRELKDDKKADKLIQSTKDTAQDAVQVAMQSELLAAVMQVKADVAYIRGRMEAQERRAQVSAITQ